MFNCNPHLKAGLKSCLKLTIYLLFINNIAACQPIDKEPLQRWQHATDGSYAANISNDGKYSVVSSIYHGVGLWDLENNENLFNWSHQQDNADNLVLAVDISDNNSHVLTASRENFALWNMKTGQSEGYWKLQHSNIRDISVANNGKYLLIGKANGTVLHITPSSGRRLEFLGHKEKINSVDMMPNGRVAISGGSDFIAYVWDTSSGQVIYRFNHKSRVSRVALDPKGRYAFSADSMKIANIWDLKTGKLISQLKHLNRQEIFSSVQFSPDGKQLLTGSPSRRVNLWDIQTGKKIASWRVKPKDKNRPSGAVVYSAVFRDNNHIITESSSGYAELWPIPKQ